MLADWIELRQEPGGVAVGGEGRNDGFEVEDFVLAVDGRALGTVVWVISQGRSRTVSFECYQVAAVIA